MSYAAGVPAASMLKVLVTAGSAMTLSSMVIITSSLKLIRVETGIDLVEHVSGVRIFNHDHRFLFWAPRAILWGSPHSAACCLLLAACCLLLAACCLLLAACCLLLAARCLLLAARCSLLAACCLLLAACCLLLVFVPGCCAHR